MLRRALGRFAGVQALAGIFLDFLEVADEGGAVVAGGFDGLLQFVGGEGCLAADVLRALFFVWRRILE